MKRKYSLSMFLLGLLQTAIRYFLLLLIGIVFLIVGNFGIKVLKSMGLATILFYTILCFVEQLKIRSMSLKQSDNQEFNEIMDSILGIRSNNDEDPVSFEELIKRKNDPSNKDDEE